MNTEELFRKLVSISSPSWKESAIAEFIRNTMTDYGYLCLEDSYGNMLFYLNTAGSKLMFSAHMDTVAKAGNAHLIETEDRFMTDGTTALGADDKCALAALIAVAESKPDVLFLFTVAEEQGLAGSALIDRSFFDSFSIKAAFIFDIEGDIGKAAISAPGKAYIKLMFHGISAHAGFEPEKGRSALLAAAEAAAAIPSGRIDNETTANIGCLVSEGSINVVPDYAEMKLEVRSQSIEKLEALISDILSIAQKTADKAGNSLESNVKLLYKPYRIGEESKALQLAGESADMIGRKLETAPTSGGSDANTLRALGIDAIVLSAGYIVPHSTAEHIGKAELRMLEKQIKALISLS